MNEASERDDSAAVDALNVIILALTRLDQSSRERVLQSVATFFGSSLVTSTPTVPDVKPSQRTGLSGLDFSADNAPSPKQFLMEKQPRTDVERIACLAYYLTHYRDIPHFKTLDLG